MGIPHDRMPVVVMESVAEAASVDQADHQGYGRYSDGEVSIRHGPRTHGEGRIQETRRLQKTAGRYGRP